MRRWMFLVALAASFWTVPGEALFAQETAESNVESAAEENASPSQDADSKVEYVVQEGDTLEGITQRFLGTNKVWRRNLELNPELRGNPDYLRPGQKLLVYDHLELERSQAQIVAIEREVDKYVRRSDSWSDVDPGAVRQGQEQIGPGDGVRTGDESSAELVFNEDQSRLIVTERSEVFLRQMETTLTNVSRSEIEITSGQADVQLQPRRADRQEVEIRVGSSITRPQYDRSGRASTRARAQDGSSQIMVYRGAANVASAGTAVAVEKGMGTTMEEGEPPAPPEKLLPSPALTSPPVGFHAPIGNPIFRWQPVEKAASYTIEVCRDTECSALVARETGLEKTQWQPPEGLPGGPLRWRVTAVSTSGLDGFPAGQRTLSVDAGRIDREAPVAVVAVHGMGRVLESGEIELGPGGGLRVFAHDDVAGVERLRVRWNAGEWIRIEPGDVVLPPSQEVSSEGTLLEVAAGDYLGREMEPFTVKIRRGGGGEAAAPTLRRIPAR